ncbi:uncharacterized protein E1O_13750 [Burkholderiales bacterium GJ-E10]|nr:uncharacterized protein E1O_13750 [Burkholderiales bacterium GJ-E10]
MTAIAQTPLAPLDAETRLLSPVYKGPVAPDTYAFRGELALKFAEKLSDEARPPEIKLDQVMMTASVGGTAISFFAGFGVSLEHLGLFRNLLGDKLDSSGKYFFFAGNLDISKRYRIDMDSATFWVLPLDEATVYNEMLELLRIEKNELKKLDTAGKLRVIAEKAADFSDSWPTISFEDGLRIMGPVKVKENRPV